MIKYEKMLHLYCTVLYCSIDVLGCDCCKKLCGKVKSGEEGVQKEKSVEKSKKTEWEYFKKYNTPEKREDAWRIMLYRSDHEYDDVVPVVFEQHDKNKGCVLSGTNDAEMISVQKNINVQVMYNMIFKEDKLKSLVLYFNGNPNLAYDGTNTTLGGKFISDEYFLSYKNSEDPLLKRTVFISYYAES